MTVVCEAELVPRTALTLEEVAESVGVSVNTVRRHILPTIKTVRLGTCVVIYRSELESWLERNGTLNTTYG